MMHNQWKYQYMDSYPLGIRLRFCFSEIQKVIGLYETHFGTSNRIR
jgi:hypothetical protein